MCGVLLSRPGSSLRASFFIHVVEDLQSHVMACNVVPFVVVSWIMSFRVTLHLCGGRFFLGDGDDNQFVALVATTQITQSSRTE